MHANALLVHKRKKLFAGGGRLFFRLDDILRQGREMVQSLDAAELVPLFSKLLVGIDEMLGMVIETFDNQLVVVGQDELFVIQLG